MSEQVDIFTLQMQMNSQVCEAWRGMHQDLLPKEWYKPGKILIFQEQATHIQHRAHFSAPAKSHINVVTGAEGMANSSFLEVFFLSPPQNCLSLVMQIG